MRQPNPVKALTPVQTAYVMGSLIVTGASCLVIELVGARVLSPYYGSSIYVWSAQITVTMISLAAGYHLGGRWADRGASLTQYARVVSLSAAGAAVVPLLRSPILAGTAGLGVEWGSIASALALFSPSLVLLGAAGPLAVKLTTQGMNSVGRGTGDVYSLSTLGSVAGAVLTGYALIPYFAVSKILFGTACLLLLLGALGYWLSRQKFPVAELAAAAACAMYGFWPRAEVKTNLLVNRESAYGQIKVLDYGTKRYLLVNGTTQSMAKLPSLESESQYAHGIEWAALQRPNAKNALVIGVGAGLLPKSLEKYHNLEVDSVDVDPAIIETAKSHFAFEPKGVVVADDGRLFVQNSKKKYDLIFLDAFGTETPPYQLFTAESFEAMKNILAPGGILAVNLVTKVHEPGVTPWRSADKTVRSVFPHVRAFLSSELYNDLGNVLFFCANEPLGKAPKEPRASAREDLKRMFDNELAHDPAKGLLMTDDYAPLESLTAGTSLVWRKSLQEKIGSVLLY
jgi:spermidine synthase